MKRLGIIGCGVIGGYLYQKMTANRDAEVVFVYDTEPSKLAPIPPAVAIGSPDEMLRRGADLVVEAAHPQAVKAVGPAVMRVADLLPFSLTAFSDEAFRAEMEAAARSAGRSIYIPHGAILALDGIADGRHVLEAVRVTTTKHPKSLGVPPTGIDVPVVLFDGPTREACHRFPRNVNVHAAVALAGLGFDRTQSTIVADPTTALLAHVIEVTGVGLKWRIEVESRSVGEVTGAYTPESVLQTVRRILLRGGGFRLA